MRRHLLMLLAMACLLSACPGLDPIEEIPEPDPSNPGTPLPGNPGAPLPGAPLPGNPQPGPRPIPSNAEWITGVSQSSQGLSCFGNLSQIMVTAFASYLGTNDTSFPRVGDVTYLQGLAGLVGSPCAGDAVGFEFLPPDGTAFAVSATHPVKCAIIDFQTGARSGFDREEGRACLQNPEQGRYGAFFAYSTLESGYALEVQVPVRVTRTLRGIAGGDADSFLLAVQSRFGLLAPKVGVFVSP